MNLTLEEMTLVAVLTLGVLAAGVLCWAFYWEYRKKRLLHEERRSMIEKGLTPPPIVSGAWSWPQVKQHEQQLKYEERRLRIEKGMEVPEETKPATPEDYLRRGVIAFCVGLGLVLAYAFVDVVDSDARSWLGVLGPTIGLYGLGNVVYYFLMPKPREQNPASNKS
jgi:hypothetical protein